ncbi:MAG TPA: ABC transporter permease [Terriglobales bacterium]|nr:ABC transporter permease [Terriglobales bacterium]
METLLQDLRFAARALLKNPAFTFIAILTLALGIGANSAVFSTVNAFLLRPLPVQNPDRLMAIAAHQASFQFADQISYLDYKDIRRQNDTFSSFFAYDLAMAGVTNGQQSQQAFVAYVTSDFFPGLGLKPALGNFFAGDDVEKPGADPVMVLAYKYWTEHFSSDPDIVGKHVKVDGHPVTVIGVAPKGFVGLFTILETQGYLPFGMSSMEEDGNLSWTKRDDRNLLAFGVLKPGVKLNQAQASLNVIAGRLEQEYPSTNKGVGLTVAPERLSRPHVGFDKLLFVIFGLFLGLAALVLLLACANIANLLLARATIRQRELAIRAALGAGRARLIRQLLTESLLLAALGGTAGILVGEAASLALSSLRFGGTTLPIHLDFSFDWRVFTYACGAALVTGLIVGIAPALRAARTNVADVLHEGGRSSSATHVRNWTRNSFVIAQIAGSFVLLVIAGLFVRSLENAQRVYLGFDPSGVVNFGMDPHLIGYTDQQSRDFYRNLEDRMRALPGVEAVSTAASVPLGYENNDARVYVEGQPIDDKHPPANIVYNQVDPGYFSTMRVPLLQGRAIVEADDEKAPLVAVINQEMAKRFWPNQDPIGKRFSNKSATGPWMQVIGVAANGKYDFLTGPAEPYFYDAVAQDFTTFRMLQLRVSGDPETYIPEVEHQIHELAPELPLFEVQTMKQSLGGANGFFFFQLGANFSLALGLLGLTLALVGVYGVLSYVTAQRTQEIGIRMALGAERSSILGMVLRQGVVFVAIGIVIGLAASLAAAKALSGMFVGVSAADPLTLASVTVFLVAVALFASYVPARRATKVDPMIALRYE